MSDADFVREVEEMYQRIAEADTSNFVELAKIAGLDIKTDLVGTDLSGTDLGDTDLSGADLSGANLSKADLFMANLSGANLSKANLSEAKLLGANLKMADLSEAKLLGATLKRADLSEADLSEADLRRANLSEADLRRANLKRADLRMANLKRAKISLMIKLLIMIKLDWNNIKNLEFPRFLFTIVSFIIIITAMIGFGFNKASVFITEIHQYASHTDSPISEKEATDLIERWLVAKRTILAPPYDRNLAAQLLTGEAYERVLSDINWLEKNNDYLTYKRQKIDKITMFKSEENQAIIGAIITEERFFNSNNGSIGKIPYKKNTYSVQFELQRNNNKLKISNSAYYSTTTTRYEVDLF